MDGVAAAIETSGLSKRYGSQLALDGLSLRVERGEIFGFLGPNGAGKTTTIRLLLDLIRPSAGRAAILGHDCQANSREVRRVTGYLPGDLRLYSGLRGRETATLFARLRGEAGTPALIHTTAAAMDLDLEKKTGAYSKGNRQKLGLLIALLGNPRVLLLDEPTSGLDPLQQHVVLELLREQATRGVTVFFSSHIMSEVEQVCERVAILREGHLIDVEAVAAIKARAFRRVLVTFTGEPPPPGVFDGAGIRESRREGTTVTFEVPGHMDALLKALAGYTVADLVTEQPALDELLLRFYREEARA